jgi:hypothetical protein
MATSRRAPDAAELLAALNAVSGWLSGSGIEPARADLARAVRLSLRTLAATAPGNTVEVRVPPYAAVQCVAGPRHTRGTPPNVIETDPHTWLLLSTGRLHWAEAVEQGTVSASGTRADISELLPIARLPAARGEGER